MCACDETLGRLCPRHLELERVHIEDEAREYEPEVRGDRHTEDVP